VDVVYGLGSQVVFTGEGVYRFPKSCVRTVSLERGTAQLGPGMALT